MTLKLKRILPAIMLALSFAPPVAADPFDDATAAYTRGDYVTILRLMRPLADQGDLLAQYDLGGMYDNGLGVPQDYIVAAKWYRLSAEQGYVLAQFNLGLLYDRGRGVSQNDDEAVKWYRLAAGQGNASAQLNLGTLYAQGRGVKRDYVSALMWFNLSLAQGEQRAAKARDMAAKLLTLAQIAEAQRLASEWKPSTPRPSQVINQQNLDPFANFNLNATSLTYEPAEPTAAPKQQSSAETLRAGDADNPTASTSKTVPNLDDRFIELPNRRGITTYDLNTV